MSHLLFSPSAASSTTASRDWFEIFSRKQHTSLTSLRLTYSVELIAYLVKNISQLDIKDFALLLLLFLQLLRV